MQLITTAKYFDGKTSKPHNIELEVFSQSCIAFYFDNRRVVWNFRDINFDKNNLMLILTNKNNASQIIKLENPEIAETIYQSAKQSNHLTWYQNIINLGAKLYISALLLIIGIIISFYVFVTPWIGERAVDILPTSFDDKLGDVSYEHSLDTLQIDQKKSAILQDFAKQINFGTHRTLNFLVVNNNEINAFALPNGTVIVYTGLLSKIENYEELAALLGHEVSHVKNRHSTKTIARSLAGYIMISALVGDANSVMTIISKNANELNNLSFSRSFEKQSDEESYSILKMNRINPKGILQLFEIIKSSDKTNNMAILSTHPLTDERIEFAKKMISKKEYQFSNNPKLEELFLQLK